jgi:hypothetical protein
MSIEDAITELILSILSGIAGLAIGASVMILIFRYCDGWWMFQWIQRIENKFRKSR